ncbi:unnamed protein product [Rotaria sordida]|uniref:Beta-fructofuranosidase n=1 Tax=Rotaria sordida TaxID=392033 RepID=A0A813SI16_9BILA|nr:unnamed protein product [Rotaria sordida]
MKCKRVYPNNICRAHTFYCAAAYVVRNSTVARKLINWSNTQTPQVADLFWRPYISNDALIAYAAYPNHIAMQDRSRFGSDILQSGPINVVNLRNSLSKILQARADDQFHPQYHLLPPSNWLNDPNGPVYYNGYYHMFFQYDPDSPVGRIKYWGHCYSKDMVHWVRLPNAIAPDQTYDINGIWTGSTSIVDGVPIIIYTGINATNAQVQCQARPANITDPTLTKWIKEPSNPLITSPSGRDPSTAFQDDQNNYYLIYGFGSDELGGQAVLFTSRDFVNWTYLHPIHSNHYDTFWECPDIFNVSNRLVMKASLRGQDFWAVGELDSIEKIFHPLAGDLGEYTQLVDQGKFYASKSFYDPIHDQQVIVGWIAEDDDQGEKRGWQGMHSLPRSIFLSDDGLHLRSRPIEALQSLRIEESHRYFHNIILPSVIPFELVPDVSGNQIEVMINWQFPRDQDLDFGLSVLATSDGSQRTSIGLMTRVNTDFMPSWDVPGYDYFSVPGIIDSVNCRYACDQDVKCRSWTFDSSVKQRGKNHPQLVWVYINRTLSQKNPGASRTALSGTIWLESESLNNQWFLQLNIFIDHSVIEVFEPQGGRLAIATRVYPEESTAENLAVYVNNGPTTNQNLIIDTFDIWTLNGIWT